VLAIAVLSYAARFTATDEPTPADLFFRWSTVVTTLVLDGIVLFAVLAIARGLRLGDVLALRRPVSWRDAATIGVAALVLIYAVSLVEEVVIGHAGREQAVPQFWDPSRTTEFAANVAMLAVFVPIVEESLTRGLGFFLLEPFGRSTAILGTALAFAVAHGAVVDLPWVLATGLGLGYLRARTGSLYPCLLLHGAVNAIAVLASAAIAPPPV